MFIHTSVETNVTERKRENEVAGHSECLSLLQEEAVEVEASCRRSDPFVKVEQLLNNSPPQRRAAEMNSASLTSHTADVMDKRKMRHTCTQ